MQIRELAKICGVSVRTLHYYDEIGLLKPSDDEHGAGTTKFISKAIEVFCK